MSGAPLCIRASTTRHCREQTLGGARGGRYIPQILYQHIKSYILRNRKSLDLCPTTLNFFSVVLLMTFVFLDWIMFRMVSTGKTYEETPAWTTAGRKLLTCNQSTDLSFASMVSWTIEIFTCRIQRCLMEILMLSKKKCFLFLIQDFYLKEWNKVSKDTRV